jgi:hypothetical protein
MIKTHTDNECITKSYIGEHKVFIILATTHNTQSHKDIENSVNSV